MMFSVSDARAELITLLSRSDILSAESAAAAELTTTLDSQSEPTKEEIKAYNIVLTLNSYSMSEVDYGTCFCTIFQEVKLND